MKNFAKKIERFLVSEDGPTAVEYAIMAALVGVVVITGATLLGEALNNVFTRISTKLDAVGVAGP